MSQQPGLCRLFASPGGCRYGNRCKYLHSRGDLSPSRSPVSPRSSPARSRSQTPAPESPRSPKSPNRVPNGVPRNVCQFFWSTGACVRGFDCSYRHVKQAGATASVQGEAGEATAAHNDDDDALDFFSPEGLAIGAGSVREERHNLNPSEVHNHLKEFLRDNYRFDSAAQAQGFVRVLASVNDRNKSWVCSIL